MGAESGADEGVRVRFAPSPTGFLHVGSARTALFNWLFARHHGGTYLLRIEDTDEERNRQDWSEGIVTALDWLGIPPDEPAVYQSSRSADHQEAIDQLWGAGLPLRLRLHPRAGDRPDQGQRHPWIRRLLPRSRSARGPGNALQVQGPRRGVRRGPRPHHAATWSSRLSAIEDFVVVKSNGGPLFVLANVVDDRSMGITHVIRGRTCFRRRRRPCLCGRRSTRSSAGSRRRRRVRLPAYAHLPMLVNEKREKISKRRDDVAVESYRAQGFLPEAFTNYLALLGWGHPEGIEIFDVADVVAMFALEDVHHAPAFFDVAKLRHVNAEHLRALPSEAFVERRCRG